MSHVTGNMLKSVGNTNHVEPLRSSNTMQSITVIGTPRSPKSKVQLSQAKRGQRTPRQALPSVTAKQKTTRWLDEETADPSTEIENRDPQIVYSRKLKQQVHVPAEEPPVPPGSPVSWYWGRDRGVSRSPLTDDGESCRDRRDSIFSRTSSRQSRYHDVCTPIADPSLIIGSKARRTRLQELAREHEVNSRQRRPSSFVSTASLLSHRESVVNLIYSGREDPREEKRYFNSSPAPSAFSRMALSLPDEDFCEGDYMVIEEDDYSTARSTRSRSSSSCFSYPMSGRSTYRSGFLYQQLEFKELAETTPPFVRQHADKTGRLTTDTFILKMNLLRRRRHPGDSNNKDKNNKGGNKGGDGRGAQGEDGTTKHGSDGSSSATTPRH